MRGMKRLTRAAQLFRICGHPLTSFSPYIRSDWSACESVGTSKKLQARIEFAPLDAHHDISAALEGAGVEDFGRADRVDPHGLVNMAGDAHFGPDFLDEPARRRAADRLAA